MLEKIMACYGSAITLTRGDSSRVIRGFLQLAGEKTAEGTYSSLGSVPMGRFSYFGTEQVLAGDTLEVDGEAYLVRQAEAVQGRDGPLYYWGSCVKKGEAEPWGS